MAHKGPRKLIVVAGYKNHPVSLARTSQQFLNHIVVGLWPKPPAAQLPAIDDVPDQVEVLARVVPEKVQQSIGLAPWSAKVQVRDEYGPVSLPTEFKGSCVLAPVCGAPGMIHPGAQSVERGSHQAPRKWRR
jgi:hypothetical protein